MTAKTTRTARYARPSKKKCHKLATGVRESLVMGTPKDPRSDFLPRTEVTAPGSIGRGPLRVEVHTAVDATLAAPADATHGAAVVPFVAASTAVAFVVLGAARDRAVSVNDQRAGTRRHAVEGN